MHVILKLAEKYPQIKLPVVAGMNKTEEYKEVCLRTGESDRMPDFTFSDKDTLEIIETEAGPAEVITLYDRGDFEHMIQCLAYRCEPTEIPASMGAMTLIGLNDWEKVRADAEDYKGTIIILSSGMHSNVSAEDVAKATDGEVVLTDEEWIEKSITIRKYHELRHFVDRKLRPDDVDALRDEINADHDGLVAAFGTYNKKLAKLFLGIEGKVFRPGGRLENYVEDINDIETCADRVRCEIDEK